MPERAAPKEPPRALKAAYWSGLLGFFIRPWFRLSLKSASFTRRASSLARTRWFSYFLRFSNPFSVGYFAW
jgi:hypothetical protein